LAVGTSQYDCDGFDDLTDVPAAVKTLVDTFTALGFEAESKLNLQKTEFEATTTAFLRSDWRPDDIAVVYVTGHGVVHLGRHYLVASDSKYGDYVSCVGVDHFLVSLPEATLLRHYLLLIDTCYAEGGVDAMRNLSAVLRGDWPNKAAGREFWMMGSARLDQTARQQVFADAFSEALTILRQSSGTYYATIGLNEVGRTANQVLGSRKPAIRQRVVTDKLVSTTDEGDRFFGRDRCGR
jgi:hypothetical protein